jgi:hypothetical protein
VRIYEYYIANGLLFSPLLTHLRGAGVQLLIVLLFIGYLIAMLEVIPVIIYLLITMCTVIKS